MKRKTKIDQRTDGERIKSLANDLLLAWDDPHPATPQPVLDALEALRATGGDVHEVVPRLNAVLWHTHNAGAVETEWVSQVLCARLSACAQEIRDQRGGTHDPYLDLGDPPLYLPPPSHQFVQFVDAAGEVFGYGYRKVS